MGMTGTNTTSSTFESLTGSVGTDFPEYDAPPAEPMGLAQAWLATAEERGVREPRALALATADPKGRASTRIVAILSATGRGLVFASHASSRKGREIAATGWASGLLYWRETGQQLIISGPVERMDDAEADALWYARPTPLHAMSVASHQSDSLADVAELRREAERLAASGTPLPRPERFAAYRLVPAEVEFWSAAADRLHRRLHYVLEDREWTVRRLHP